MPKIGMEPIRRQQLIDATLQSIAELGMQATTINSISQRAGLSSGIISHYFGGKQGLLEASVRYLLSNLKSNLLEKTKHNCDAKTRLMFIIEVNFSILQKQTNTTRTWLSFWSHSMHDEMLHRLQKVNSNRLYSNLLYSFKQLLSDEEARSAAKSAAGMIDGLWLRAVLNKAGMAEFKEAEQLAKKYINSLISPSGI